MNSDDASALETIAGNFERAGMFPFQAAQLREIAARVRVKDGVIDDIIRETEEEIGLVEGAAQARNDAIARGEAIRLRPRRHLVVDADGRVPEGVA